MGKISQVTSKYIVHATIEIDGVVDRPDIIGAVFGQTEGLLGADLELRELQRSGRIGRIEVNVDIKNGRTVGGILIPSSLDKAETAIVAAAMEIIQRIGPCNAKLAVTKIEDIRISKRKYVIERAKQLLKDLVEGVIPDSQELASEVSASVRVQEIVEWGRERLPAGPAVEESEELIIVEGRADVINLLKHGFKNAIAMNGTSVPPSLLELCKRKDVTIFCDGDRGGDLIIKEMLEVAEIDWVTKAPDGMEVEEITKKEIHKALRSKINVEQARHEYSSPVNALKRRRMMSDVEPGAAPGQEAPAPAPARNPPDMRGQDQRARPIPAQSRPDGRNDRRMPPAGPMQGAAPAQAGPKRPVTLSPEERKKFGTMLESLVGTRGAYLLDPNQNILGKVPLSELSSTLKSLSKGNVYAVLLDGPVEKEIVESCEYAGIKHIVGMDSKVNPRETGVNIVVAEAL